MSVALLAIVLSMIVKHGLLGILLVLPPLMIVSWCSAMVEIGRLRAAMVGFVIYAACWLATGWIGVPMLRQKFDRDISIERNYYIRNTYSPCPFVVTFEYRFDEPASEWYGRVYMFWCFGYIGKIYASSSIQQELNL